MHFKVYSKYFYSLLDDDGKSAYRQILDGWLNYEEEITIHGLNGKVNFDTIVHNIVDDIPELFYVDLNNSSISHYSDNKVTLNTGFKYSKEDCEEYKRRIAVVVSQIEQLCAGEADKEKIIHDYFVKNVTYTEGEPGRESYNIIGPLLNKDAVCEGISKAFKLLCDAVGIPCIFTYGDATASDGKTEAHAWNIVRKDGKTYHVDVTWDVNLKAFAEDAPYYNVSDEHIGKNHIWEQGKWPVCYTKGELENNIIDVFGLNSLTFALNSMRTQKKNSFILRFNKKFASTQEVLDVIKKIIYKKQIGISSLSAAYSPALDCAFITAGYR